MNLLRTLGLSVLLLLLAGPLPLAAQTDILGVETVLATYPVHNGVVDGSPTEDEKAIWAIVKQMIPAPLLNLVDTLEFFETPPPETEEEASTDGYATLNESDTTFTLGLNLAEAKVSLLDRDEDHLPIFLKTIWHEFGHILSFQASQRDLTATVKGTLVVEEGTMKADSYLNQYYEKFWKKAYPGRGPETLSDEEGAALYATAPDAFVSEYAATGPLEDFAESFSVFIVDPLPQGKTIRDQKVKFFAASPELVALRNQAQMALAAQ